MPARGYWAKLQARKVATQLWDGPIFDKAFDQRRLRILNALFICLTRCGMQPHLSGKHGRDIFVTVGNTAVPLSIDAVGAAKRIEDERYGRPFQARGDKEGMRLAFSRWRSPEPDAPSWEDKPGDRLERHLREIAAAIVVFGEQEVRETAVRFPSLLQRFFSDRLPENHLTFGRTAYINPGQSSLIMPTTAPPPASRYRSSSP